MDENEKINKVKELNNKINKEFNDLYSSTLKQLNQLLANEKNDVYTNILEAFSSYKKLFNSLSSFIDVTNKKLEKLKS